MPAKLVLKVCEKCKIEFQGAKCRKYCSVMCTNAARAEIQDLTLDSAHCNHHYFQMINTLEKAYWLGFLFADGYITPDKRNVRLCLSVKDEDQLDRFVLAVDGLLTEKRYYGPYKTSGKQVHYYIRSKQMCEDLEVLGCFHKKSLLIRFPALGSYELDLGFMMGYYDGDGSQHGTDFVTGSKLFMDDVIQKFGITNKLQYDKYYSISLGVKFFRKMQAIIPFSMPRKRILLLKA